MRSLFLSITLLSSTLAYAGPEDWRSLLRCEVGYYGIESVEVLEHITGSFIVRKNNILGHDVSISPEEFGQGFFRIGKENEEVISLRKQVSSSNAPVWVALKGGGQGRPVVCQE